MHTLNRIMIIGNSGAGKSTLARYIAQRLQLDLIHLDQYYWRPDWTEPPKAEWNEKVRQFTQQKKWVIDGNYTSSIGLRLKRADTIIFLDRSPLICLWNVLKRLWYYYGRTRPDLSPGCPERLDWSFLKYVYRYNRDYRPRVLKQLAKRRPETTLIILQKRKEIDTFLRNLTPGDRP